MIDVAPSWIKSPGIAHPMFTNAMDCLSRRLPDAHREVWSSHQPVQNDDRGLLRVDAVEKGLAPARLQGAKTCGFAGTAYPFREEKLSSSA
jgi:hypothetical protein